jgi:type IV pilus assembly protein PilY1
VRIRNIDSADGVMVYVGTGKFFEPGDLTDSSVQSFYAVLDKGDGNTYSRSSGLVQQTIAAAITIEIIDGVARPARTTSSNPVNYAAGDRGFFIDLVRDKERVLKQAEFLSRSRSKGSIVFPSFIPTGDACTGGILGDWTELNALSGQKVDAADAMLFPGANSVEMGPGGTSFGIPLGGIWTELGGGDGGLGCLGCDETPQQRICGNHIAVDSETGVPTLPQCGSPGRKSWRQLR